MIWESRGPAVFCQTGRQSGLFFRDPAEVITATRIEEVLPALRQVEHLVDARGWHAAGFVAYEASPAFDAALQAHPPDGFPLVWFGLYHRPRPADLPGEGSAGPESPRDWRPSVTGAEYAAAVCSIKERIARGETYQVNYTLRLRAPFAGDPVRLFHSLVAAQQASYTAYVDTGRYIVCSASPELLFRLEGENLESRPMKGTAPRGRDLAEDLARARALRRSPKDRAENVMIVDMVRNDLGRLARPGSVQVPQLCRRERYPTVWQLTSRVRAKTDAPFHRIVQALFPAASVTGAPRISTTAIIRELESEPRRIYTGAIGCLQPGRKAQFNVAIRTVLIDRERRCAEYGVGGGIVWDSRTAAEEEEWRTKARVLRGGQPPFALLETMLWTPAGGYFLGSRHLRRMRDSARYFGYRFPSRRIEESLARQAQSMETASDREVGRPAMKEAGLEAGRVTGPKMERRPHRVRLTLGRDQEITISAETMEPPRSRPVLRLGLAAEAVDSRDPFLFHKTTYRRLYEEARAGCADGDDVLLFNERGEITETSVANVAVHLDGEWVTPPVFCGLLAGTLRSRLVERGRLRERVVRLEDLERAQAMVVFNSVRRFRRALPASEDPADLHRPGLAGILRTA